MPTSSSDGNLLFPDDNIVGSSLNISKESVDQEKSSVGISREIDTVQTSDSCLEEFEVSGEGRLMENFSSNLSDLPIELIGYIAGFAGFREINILCSLVPEVCDKYYLRDIGSPSLESAVDRDCVYEVIYRLKKNPQPKFCRTILLARAIRMCKWRVIRCLVTLFKTEPNLWDVFKAVKNGLDATTISMLISTYQEPQLERIRPACLVYSEMFNNIDVFLLMLKQCREQKRRHKQIHKILSSIDDRKWCNLVTT